MSNVFNQAWLQSRGGYGQGNDGLASLQAAYGQQSAKLYQAANSGMQMQSQRHSQQSLQQTQQSQQQGSFGLANSEYSSMRGGVGQKASMPGEQSQGGLYDYAMLHSAANAFSQGGKGMHNLQDVHYEALRQQQQQQQRSPHPQSSLSHQSQQRMGQGYEAYQEAAAPLSHGHQVKSGVSTHASPSISHQQQPGSNTSHGTPQGPALSQQPGYAMHSRLSQPNPTTGGGMSHDMLDLEQFFGSVHGGGRSSGAAAGQLHHGYGSGMGAVEKGLDGGLGASEVGYHGSRDGYGMKAQMGQGGGAVMSRGMRKATDARTGMLSPSISGGVMEEDGMGPSGYGVHAGHVDSMDAYGRPQPGSVRMRGGAGAQHTTSASGPSSIVSGSIHSAGGNTAAEDFLGMAVEAADIFGPRASQQAVRGGVAGSHRSASWMGHTPNKTSTSIAKSPEHIAATPPTSFISPESPDEMRGSRSAPHSPGDPSHRKRRRSELEVGKRSKAPPPALQLPNSLTPTSMSAQSQDPGSIPVSLIQTGSIPVPSSVQPAATVYNPHAKEVEMPPGAPHIYVEEDESEPLQIHDTAGHSVEDADHPVSCHAPVFGIQGVPAEDPLPAVSVNRSQAENSRLPPTAALVTCAKLDLVKHEPEVELLDWLFGKQVKRSAICT